ncbi:MAG: Na+/H+ antiporter NhaC family protein, partial [Mailhella sp.]|nr:Na+/H+ antiporter NhaC family protein [Mailhella sp.]
MDPYYAGWLSIVPPVLAIVLALITKEVFSSLLLGILSGALIYSIGIDADFVAIHTIDVTFKTMAERIDFNIILFCSLLGALVYVISLAGGT